MAQYSFRKPFVLACTGSSLTRGRLAAFPVGWVEQLERELPLQPEAVGPVVILPHGHGGWASADILNEAPTIAGLNPTHIFAESGDINDCVVTGGVPAYTRAQKLTNMASQVTTWRAGAP